MPLEYSMTWVKGQKRWLKWYKGKQYGVSCKQLGQPATKEQSGMAANLWWEVKQAEIDAAAKTAEETPEALAARRVAEVLVGIEETPEFLEAEKAGRRAETMRMWGKILDTATTNPVTAALLVELEKNHGSISRTIAQAKGGEAVEGGRSIGHQVKAWLATEMASANNKAKSEGRYADYGVTIKHLVNFIGDEKPVAVITAAKWDEFTAHLQVRQAEGPNKLAPTTIKKILFTARRFVKWLYRRDLITLPKNLDDLRIQYYATEPEHVSLEDVQAYLAGCEGFSERSKLYLLLMLNCGFYQNDIATLTDAEVDWELGTINRVRSKIARRMQLQSRTNAAKVKYLLWPETFALLKKYRSKTGLVLVTDEGKPLVDAYRDATGKPRRYDAVRSAFERLSKKVGLHHPLKCFRKTSANELEKHPTYKYYKDHFWGHSPRDVAGRHYVKPDDDQFFEALRWLGGRYGLSA